MHLVSDVEGILKKIPKHLEKLNSPKFDENGELSENSIFESLFRWAGKYDSESVGEIIEKTINLHTTAGFALLIHPDKNIVDDDYFKILELQEDMYET